jgi:hypothetical protein
MAAHCRFCGLTNRPYAEACAHCARTLQAPGAAEAKRREWDALPAPLRAEYERAFDVARERFDDHVRWLRRHRWVHATLGGVLVVLPTNAALFFPTFWTIPIGFALGALAGLALNRVRGGAYRGLGLFGAAGALAVVLFLPFVEVQEYLKGWWLMHALVLAGVGGAGYYLGLKLEFEHVERVMLG